MGGARCARCGRPLRDPQSIALGMGPVCRGARLPKRGGRGRKKGRRKLGGEGGTVARGPMMAAKPGVGLRCRVIRPYLAMDKERYVGRTGFIAKVLGKGMDGHWHVVVAFHDEDLPAKLRLAAFPLYCLELLPPEE